MTQLRARLGLGLALAIVAAACPGQAAAHSELIRANPPAGAVLEDPPTVVTLEMDAPPAPTSTILVLGPDFQPMQDPDTFALDAVNPRLMKIGLRPLPSGSYTVQWTAVDEVDGHKTTGSYAFEVRGPASLSTGPVPPNAASDLATATTAGLAVTATPVDGAVQGLGAGTAEAAGAQTEGPGGGGATPGAFLAGALAVVALGLLAFLLRGRAAGSHGDGGTGDFGSDDGRGDDGAGGGEDGTPDASAE